MNQSWLSEEFIVDKSLGRDVQFTLDEVPGQSGTIAAIQILYPNGTELHHSTDSIGDTTSIAFDFLEVLNKLLFKEEVVEIILFYLSARILSVQHRSNRNCGLHFSNCYIKVNKFGDIAY